MSRWPPLDCSDVKKALKRLDFEPRPQKGTSHEQWVKRVDGKLYKVTVDCPKAQFSLTLIDSMAAQAGISRRAFYQAADKKKKWTWLWR
ncbi:MAG: type II toxin-antitoxin system HicA family toxin [Halochromatium sp.]|nr:type II toxin-antitoxin system HicA family toxin [Halochromatium sp.]